MADVGTPAARVAAVEAGATIQRLIALDDLWTAELVGGSERGKLHPEEIEALSVLVSSMQQGLEFVPGQMEDLATMLDQLDDQVVEEALDRLAQYPERAVNLVEFLPDLPPDLRESIISACRYLAATSGEEAQLLDGKLAVIRERGGVPPGDFRLPFRCAALLALVGAGLVATIGIGGAPILVGLAAANQVGLGAFGWFGAKCPNVLPVIRKA
jgi:hypothetical protein